MEAASRRRGTSVRVLLTPRIHPLWSEQKQICEWVYAWGLGGGQQRICTLRVCRLRLSKMFFAWFLCLFVCLYVRCRIVCNSSPHSPHSPHTPALPSLMYSHLACVLFCFRACVCAVSSVPTLPPAFCLLWFILCCCGYLVRGFSAAEPVNVSEVA